MDYPKENFLLGSEAAEEIYAEIASLPILDYHCHLSPKELYENRPFSDLGEAWLKGDHYKWRVMRAAGVPERLVTGEAPYSEKLRAYASVMPSLAGNPLYHFSHLELKNYFGITLPLAPDTVDEIAKQANERLKTMRARDFITASRVEGVITTDAPQDSLRYHERLKEEFSVPVLPAFRPDEALYIERPGFPAFLSALGAAAKLEISNYDDLKHALVNRLDFFAEHGAPAADHGLDYVPYEPDHARLAKEAFSLRRENRPLSRAQIDGYKCDLLLFLFPEYAQRNIVSELHFGCYRNGNAPAFARLGADAGFDGIRSQTRAEQLYPLLSEGAAGGLPRTILFSLNPSDNATLNTVAAAFQKEGERGWVQQGSAWWFNDHLYGMREQLKAYASTLPIGTFAGMLTDSRSLLSYARHEYFRRVLADYLGAMVQNGEYPPSRLGDLKRIARAIAYENTKEYFRFPALGATK